MITYCIACYRPAYCRHLIDQLVEKTTAAYEILVWINLLDEAFENFLRAKTDAGAPIRIVGRTPENIGMAAYPKLFASGKFDMVVQIDDDVVCISPGIAECAREIFDRFPAIGMLTADTWQDEYTNGARPPMEQYREFDHEFGLHDGPIDGWFAIYRRSSLEASGTLDLGRYYPLGCLINSRLKALGQNGFLCTRFKVFHAVGAAYASYFGMLDEEIAKYAAVGLHQLSNLYMDQRRRLPPQEQIALRVQQIRTNLA